jgi:AcrR family transcriptional regulator
MQTSTLSPHRQDKRDARIAGILETARQIMRTEGVAALSMQELARRLGMRAPSLYNYFASKMDLYDSLFRLGFELYARHLDERLPQSGGWQEQMRAALEAHMAFALQHPELYQLCFERPVPGFTPSPASLQVSLEVLHRSYGQVEALLPQLNTRLDARQVADLLIAVMHGLAALHLANEPGLPVGQGRFGSLIPAVMEVLAKAWNQSD